MQKIPYIHHGNLGPPRNDLENKFAVALDTVLNDVQLKSVYYYSKDLNTEQYEGKNILRISFGANNRD